MNEPFSGTQGLLPNGLYDHLVCQAIEEELRKLADPRLFALAAVESEDAHTALAQYLEHLFIWELRCRNY